MAVPDIDPATARRIAVAASGLGRRRDGAEPTDRHLRRAVDRLGLLQIDSVSVLARAHYLPLFSRLGPYPTALLDEAAWGRKRWSFECWAHQASLVPLAQHPLFRWRMQRAAAGLGIYTGLSAFAAENRPYLDSVMATIRAGGPTRAADLDQAGGAGGWWGWSPAKQALEYLFRTGAVSVATRRGFERVYDLTERVIPRRILALPTPSVADAHRDLLRIAARSLGIATAGDLADYHRITQREASPRIAELVEAGELVRVQVRGWAQPAYVHRDARWPRRVSGQALVTPFDPLVWFRPRTERLFGFQYRIGIYTPAAQREHGYYVLPFLLGDRLVARVDLKSDRAAGALRVLSAHSEPLAPAHTVPALAAEVALMARWLGLERVLVTAAGDLGPSLAAACAPSSPSPSGRRSTSSPSPSGRGSG
ncbi:MAG TPA: crosslink repair DNA glycosylase YcaQ family protein [Acetobacteraceae bacterium]|nr:crosslink repair DNA glycosylase YcaQ family protein [Acetobacteraceae bacterium]